MLADVVGVIGGVLFGFILVAAVVGSEVANVRARRLRLTGWAEAQGLRLMRCRYSFRLLRPLSYFRSLVAFRIEVEDRTGHITAGTAWISGRFRDQLWVDWD